MCATFMQMWETRTVHVVARCTRSQQYQGPPFKTQLVRSERSMIVVHNPSPLFRLFAYRTSIVPIILPHLIFSTLWGVTAALLNFILRTHTKVDAQGSFPTLTPFSVLGVAISLFLSFRTNACYNRWWEARTQWGMHYNMARNLARVACTLLRKTTTSTSSPFLTPNVPLEVDTKINVHAMNIENTCIEHSQDVSSAARCLARMGLAHCHAMRAQLRARWYADRGSIAGPAVREAEKTRDSYLEPTCIARISSSSNPALMILHMAGELVGRQLEKGHLDTVGAVEICRQLEILCNCQGAAERISNTLVPFSYSLLVHRMIVFYILIAPFAMVSVVHWYTPFFNLVIAYAFFGLDEVARQCEQPYGDEPNSLALDAICRNIDMGVLDVLGDNVPPPLLPDKECRLR